MVRTALVSQNSHSAKQPTTTAVKTTSPKRSAANIAVKKGVHSAVKSGAGSLALRNSQATRKTNSPVPKKAVAKTSVTPRMARPGRQTSPPAEVTGKKATANKADAKKRNGKNVDVLPCRNSLSRTEIEQCAEEWLLDCEYQQLAAVTIQTRRMFLKGLMWFLHNKGLDACGTDELREFFHYLRHGHKEPGGRWGNPQLTKPLRPISIKDYYICLQLFFDWMVKEEILDASPLGGIERPVVREEIKQPLAQEQTEALLRAAKLSQSPQRNEAIILMLLDSGVRASELISLKVGEVDVRSGTFEVTGKGNKKRACYLGKRTTKALMAYLRKAKLKAQDPLFPSVRGGAYSSEPITRSGLLQLIKRLAKQAGVSANVHKLRRTFATTLLEAGADICSVRDMLGHTNIQMTLKYLAVSQSHIESQHRQFSPADRLKMR